MVRAKKHSDLFYGLKKAFYICTRIQLGEVAEWSNAPVLKTGEGHTSGGSNPSFSAKKSFTIVKLFSFPKVLKF